MANLEIECQALLFDLDGTLIDSHHAVNRCWGKFCERHGLVWEEVKHIVYGRRSQDSIRELLPHVNVEEENMYLRHLEATDTEGVVPLAGAAEFLAKIPKERWAIVTSGTSDVGGARFKASGLPEPGAFVFGEEVEIGKPHPDCYLLGAKKLGFDPILCVGFEDTKPGMQAIRSAGAQAIGVGADVEGMPDYQSINVHYQNGTLILTF